MTEDPLARRIRELEAELATLKLEHAQRQKQQQLELPRRAQTGLPMELEEYERYGRQMILSGMGLPAQLKLRDAAVLVVGAGALGCPALQYLAASGIGHIGIVDHDTVSRSNLHRQVLHSEATIGSLKVNSAKAALRTINPHVRVTAYDEALSPSNALEILRAYSLVLDCTDRPLTRYLVSDACVLAGKPLVSGAALGFNGQLAIYNWGPDSPCYRCVWPRVAKQPAGKGTCEEEGVLGPVTGVIGTLMALEAVKILAGLAQPTPTPPGLLILSVLSPTSPFRTFKLRRRQPLCRSCGSPPADSPLGGKITNLELEDYETFCGGPDVDRDQSGLEGGEADLARISTTDLATRLAGPEGLPDLIDVRTAEQFSIISIPGSRNVPLADFLSAPLDHLSPTLHGKADVVLLCRRGNDSQEAALALAEAARQANPPRFIEAVDVRGGVKSWGRAVRGGPEGGWPEY